MNENQQHNLPEAEPPFQLVRETIKPPKAAFGGNRGRQRELFPGCHRDLPGQLDFFPNYGHPEE